jgi:hypothetical protein
MQGSNAILRMCQLLQHSCQTQASCHITKQSDIIRTQYAWANTTISATGIQRDDRSADYRAVIRRVQQQ